MIPFTFMRILTILFLLSSNYQKWLIKECQIYPVMKAKPLIAFNNSKVTYELFLKHSGYKSKMKFDREPSTRRNRNERSFGLTLRSKKKLRLILENSFFK